MTPNRFLYAGLSLLFRLQGRPCATGKDGMTERTGWAGRRLMAMDAAMREEVLAGMARTPAGRALLDFAGKKSVGFDIQGEMPRRIGGTFNAQSLASGGGGDIEINGLQDKYSQISALAHEIRHAWQAQKIGKLMPQISHMPPDAMLAINRIIEADAFLFQFRFATDYLEKTGDHGLVLSYLYRCKDKFDAFTKAQNGQEGFLAAVDQLNATTYDSGLLTWNKFLLLCRENEVDTQKLISPAVSQKLVMAVINAIDDNWPFSDGGYLDHASQDKSAINAKILSSALHMPAQKDEEAEDFLTLQEQMKKYAALYQAQKVKAASGQKGKNGLASG